MSAADPLRRLYRPANLWIMFNLSRIAGAAEFALFLAACTYVGYVNEVLKGAVAPWHRAVIMIGFLIGAGTASRFVAAIRGDG